MAHPHRQRPGRGVDPSAGYRYAALNMLISGFAVFINSVGVKMFSDSTVYTALKNGVAGLCVIVPFLVVGSYREELRGLTARQWGLLVLIALAAGSVAYGLDFRGLQLSTPATAALIDHTQFLFVAGSAALVLRERISPTLLGALAVLAFGLVLGVQLRTVRLDAGVPFLIAATLMFAVGQVLMKIALRTTSVATVMGVKMALGSVLLFVYVALSGRASLIAHLTALQWAFTIVTGLILLGFTVTEVAGLRHASATGVTAIAAGAPVITVLLVVATRHVAVLPVQLLGLALVLVAVLAIYTVGRSDETRASAGSRFSDAGAQQSAAGA